MAAGLKKWPASGGINVMTGTKKFWTYDEDRMLRDLSESHTQKQIAELLGRTQSAVSFRAYKLNISLRKRGEKCHLSKLKQQEVELIRILLDDGMPQREIAWKMEVTQTCISSIARGTSWNF